MKVGTNISMEFFAPIKKPLYKKAHRRNTTKDHQTKLTPGFSGGIFRASGWSLKINYEVRDLNKAVFDFCYGRKRSLP